MPENEIHDLALLFFQYELLNYGRQVICLGHSLPITDLLYMGKQYNQIYYIYLTVKPDNLYEYLATIQEKVLSKTNSEYWMLGNRVKEISSELVFYQFKCSRQFRNSQNPFSYV